MTLIDRFVPCEWLRRLDRDCRLAIDDLRLAVRIAKRVDASEGTARLSHSDLERIAGTSRTAAVRSRNLLAELGYIAYQPGTGNVPSQYWLRLPDSPDDDIRVAPLALYVANHLGGVQ